MMDILIVSQGQPTSVQAVFNNYDRDAFFLKTRLISDLRLGINVPAASFRCMLTSLEDEKFMVSAGQSGQTAYQQL